MTSARSVTGASLNFKLYVAAATPIALREKLGRHPSEAEFGVEDKNRFVHSIGFANQFFVFARFSNRSVMKWLNNITDDLRSPHVPGVIFICPWTTIQIHNDTMVIIALTVIVTVIADIANEKMNCIYHQVETHCDIRNLWRDIQSVFKRVK